jgi:YesN/AraC family two-component response regulator
MRCSVGKREKGLTGISQETNSISRGIKEYIDKNYTRNITLKDIANALYVSTDYVSHIFKKELGDSPINYLINRRINEAKKLLATTTKPVSEVASMVGYDNVQYFTMLFKKVTGQSPGGYRKQF